MTDAAPPTRTKSRRAAERRFRLYGAASIVMALGALAILLGTMIAQGWPAFVQTHLGLDVDFTVQAPDEANYRALARRALYREFPTVTQRRDKRRLGKLLSDGAEYQLQDMVLAEPGLRGTRRTVWLAASDDADQYNKGHIRRGAGGRLTSAQMGWLDELAGRGAVERRFNWTFFTSGDSREPEMAGIWGAAAGSLLTMAVALLLAFPLGVASALYLEEFAPRNRLTDAIEVNINNLAAVPSIVFGLLGLAVFLNFFGMPRSAPLVGGMVLALMTLPTIIIAGRAALQAVPPSIREAALGIGASPMQVVLHHVLPLAFPGMLTGAIIGAARALGETAPLLMIGMVAFIVDIPEGVSDPATVLPVQIYLWADSPERAFVERTAAAAVVLLGFLIAMNLAAVTLRRHFERRW